MMQEPSNGVVTEVLDALGGTARTGEILAAGVHPRELYAARDAGALVDVEVTRGVFRLAELPLTEPDLVVVATRMPRRTPAPAPGGPRPGERVVRRLEPMKLRWRRSPRRCP